MIMGEVSGLHKTNMTIPLPDKVLSEMLPLAANSLIDKCMIIGQNRNTNESLHIKIWRKLFCHKTDCDHCQSCNKSGGKWGTRPRHSTFRGTKLKIKI
jgi:hypothetical protein